MVEQFEREAFWNDDEPKGLWQIAKRDWQTWNRFDRIAAPLILVVLFATTIRGLWLGS